MQKAITGSVQIKATENKQQLTLWELTDMDKSCFRWVLQAAWLFRGKADTGRIQAGLSALLGYYPHLSGRMVNRGTAIQTNNQGVPFTCASAPAVTIEEISKQVDLTGKYTNAINIARLKTGQEALLSVRLTQLSDGYVLGVSGSHVCQDGTAFYGMVNNWGRICRGESIEPPVLDQTLLTVHSSRTRQEVLADAVRQGWKKFSFLKLFKILPFLVSGRALERTAAFHFPADALVKLKTTLSQAAGCRLSTHEVLCAYLTRMFMQLFKYNSADCCVQATVMNIRNRIPYIPQAFAGNASYTVISPRLASAASIAEIARVIHEGLAPYVEKPSSTLQQLLALTLEAIKHRIPLFYFDFTTMLTKKPTTVYINNFSKLPVYTVDVGGGAPVKVFPHNLGDPLMIWPAPPDRGGVEVYFSGLAALAVHKRKPGDPWLKELLGYSGMV